MTEEVTAIATRILELREEKDRLVEEETTLWKRFFEIADDLAGENESYKVLIPELERTIAREMHQATDSLIIDDLKASLTDEEWKMVSIQTRVFDMTKLEEAIGKDKIDSDLVSKHTEHKDPVAHKKFSRATAKEMKNGEE